MDNYRLLMLKHSSRSLKDTGQERVIFCYITEGKRLSGMMVTDREVLNTKMERWSCCMFVS